MAGKVLTQLSEGATFAGDFRVEKALSAGGMGAVYVATQISTGKKRALKLMHPELLGDERLRKRFADEARVASLIESEHVVEVVGAGVDADTRMPWLAMELLQGEPLSAAIARWKRLDAKTTSLVFEQLCHAMGAAHRAGIVHRDLKPENIFLAEQKRANAGFVLKVLDFGIAKILADATTKATASLGTPLWMAPEQAQDARVDARTDVWALGLIAFHALTGRYYWKCARDGVPSVHPLMHEVLFEPLAPASERAQEIDVPAGSLPAGFDAWFARCVARETKERFDDATTLYAELASLLARHAEKVVIVVPEGIAPLGTGKEFAGVSTLSAFENATERAPEIVTPPPPRSRARSIGYAGVALVAISTLAGVGVKQLRNIEATEAATAPALPSASAYASASASSFASASASALSSASASAVDAGSSSDIADASIDAAPKPVMLSAAEYRKKGHEALAHHNWRGAHAAFEGAINQNQNDADALCGNADAYRGAGDIRSAWKFYMFCKTADRDSLAGALGFADAAWDLHQYDVARGAYQGVADQFRFNDLPPRVKERANSASDQARPSSSE
jgi:serine/threonine protein kinase